MWLVRAVGRGLKTHASPRAIRVATKRSRTVGNNPRHVFVASIYRKSTTPQSNMSPEGVIVDLGPIDSISRAESIGAMKTVVL